MTPRSLSHRAPLLGLVAAWGAGAALTHAGVLALPGGAWIALALAGLALAWAGGDRRWAWAAGLALALAAAGALRTDQQRQRLGEWDALGLPAREARLTLRVERLFAADAAIPRVGGVAVVVGAEPHLRDLTGQRVQFSATWPAGGPPALRGVEFRALGVLEPVPRHPPAKDFTRYLADSGINFSYGRARLESEPAAAGAWVRFCAAAGDKLETVLRAGLGGHDGLADLYVAMMLGRKQELSDQQEDWFVRSGTMHLFAISGLHIAGIAVAVNTLLTFARLPGRARFVIGAAILWTYVEITGGAPSAVRAFWMVTCLLGAQQLRVPSNSLSALAVSALGVLLVEPHQLFSASFQMSYGIVAALLLYGVPLQEKWLEAWRPWATLPRPDWGWRRELAEGAGRGFIGLIALGLAATLISTLATLAFFDLLTPGGFFVNLALIPASTLVLFAGVAAMLCGGIGLTPLAVLFNHAAALVLAAMEGAVVWALQFPGVAWPATFVAPWLAATSGAGMLALLALGYSRGWPAREGGYWVPYAALGLVLVLGVRSVSIAAP